MTAYLLNPVVFVGAYLAFMIPTYVLPYFGSNSVAARVATAAVAAAAGVRQPLFVPFYLHLICLAALCVLAYTRGSVVDKKWLLIFPFLAMVFDLTPVLAWIPLVPTVMHLLTIILGVVGARAVAGVSAMASIGAATAERPR